MADGKTLSSGMSLPQWMKSRMNDRLSFEQGTFSPPENDDNFLYIRYKRPPKEANGNDRLTPKVEVVSSALIPAADPPKSKTDFSNHTVPCKQFIPQISNNNAMETKNSSLKPKSSGTDDGFKGEAAACGSSVVRVAHQMVTGKLTRGFTLSDEEFATQPPDFNPSLRRGSKSLPTSPLTTPNTSPKSKRRLPNKYFTGGAVDTDKIQNSWILSGLLRKHDHLSRSVNVIAEETPETLTKSVSEMSVDEMPERTMLKKEAKSKSKPSEFRELNFWSPTSM